MFKPAKMFILLSLTAAATLLVVAACSSYKEPEIYVVPPAQKATEATAVTVAIVDALTDQPLSAQSAGAVAAAAAAAQTTFTVTLTGPDVDKIYDGNGNPIYNATTQSSTPFTGVSDFLTFYVRAAATDYPLNLRVVVSNPDFIASSTALYLEAPQGSDPLLIGESIKVTRATLSATERATLNSEVGIDVVSDSSLSADALGTTAPLTLTTTPVEAEITSYDPLTQIEGPAVASSVTATVAIPAQTVMRDANNNPVIGSLSATVSYHNPLEQSSLATFPGGLDGLREDTLGNTIPDNEPPASFISGGFTSVEIKDASGKAVKTFDSPVNITLDIPKTLGNPDTGLPVQLGDTVPLWSYDTETAEWKAHRDGSGNIIQGVVGDTNGDGILDAAETVAANADSTATNWKVTFPTTHLSYFNLDWAVRATGGGYDCTGIDSYARYFGGTAYPIDIVGARDLKFYVTQELMTGGSGASFTFPGYDNIANNDSYIRFNMAPRNTPIKFTFYLNEKAPENLVTTQIINNVCQAGNSISLDQVRLDALLNVTALADLNVRVFDRCSNDPAKTTPIPSNSVVAIKGTNFTTAMTNSTGSATFRDLTVGATYTVKAADRENSALSVRQSLTVQDGANSLNLYFDRTCEEKEVTGITGGSGSGL